MKEINIKELSFNPFEKIKNEWFLITVKNKNGKVNTMTASWGFLGNVWYGSTVLCLIRKTRYTKEFIDNVKSFTISFYDGYKEDLTYLGRVSGRNEDKISKTKLNLVMDNDYAYFKEASLVFECEKNFNVDFDDNNILDKSVISKFYSGDDLGNYHTIYFGRILKTLVKEK